MLTNREKLCNAIGFVLQIKELVEELYALNKIPFEGNKDLNNEFKQFFSTIERTLYKLNHPVLSIAMVGTTSAGKSTLVNGFTGRMIAPMEKKETSAGMLKLVHSDSIKLEIAQTPKAKWSTGVYHNMSDAEIYECIKSIYTKYKEFETKVQAPEITVSVPLEWELNRSILDLPDDLSVEFIDLPGLKTLTDPKNLEVIQKALSKALCIIAMDFNDVDKTRIERLLEEVKDIVKTMHGNTDVLLFLLNKIDDIKSVDDSVENNIEQLKETIITRLDLPEDKRIDIIPFVGHLLFSIQMAIKKEPSTGKVIEFNRKKLEVLFEDCSNLFWKSKNILSENEWKIIGKLEMGLKYGGDIVLEDVSEFYNICIKLSHADELHEELKKRVSESFSEIIIRPSMDDFTKELNKLIGDISVYININKTNSVIDLISEKIGVLKTKLFLLGANSDTNYKVLNSELKSISKIISSLNFSSEDKESVVVVSRIKKDIANIQETVNKRTNGFIDAQIDDIKESIDEISENLQTLTDEKEIVSYFNKIKKGNRAFSAFNGISDVPKHIRSTLDVKVLLPFRDCISKKETKGQFIEIMSKNIPTSLAEELSGKYEDLRKLFDTTFYSFSKGSYTYEKETFDRYSDVWKQNVLNIYRAMDLRIRDVLSRLTNVEFQKETNTLTGTLNSYLQNELSEILKQLRMSANVNNTDLSKLLKSALDVEKKEILLPGNLFQFSSPYEYQGSKNTYVGQKIVGYKTHSCSSDETIYESEYKDKYTYKYDNEVALYQKWEKGITGSLNVFWGIITDWIKESVEEYMRQIKDISLKVTNMVELFLEERMRQIKENKEVDFALFDILDNKLNEIQQSSDNFILK